MTYAADGYNSPMSSQEGCLQSFRSGEAHVEVYGSSTALGAAAANIAAASTTLGPGKRIPIIMILSRRLPAGAAAPEVESQASRSTGSLAKIPEPAR